MEVLRNTTPLVSAHHRPCVSVSFPSSFPNNNQSPASDGASISVPTIAVSASLPSVSAGRGSSAASGGFSELRSSSGSRKARVLYDYDAASSSELSLLADEVSLKVLLFCGTLLMCLFVSIFFILLLSLVNAPVM